MAVAGVVKIYLLEIGAYHDSAEHRYAFLSYKSALSYLKNFDSFEGECPVVLPWKYYHRWGKRGNHHTEYRSTCLRHSEPDDDIEEYEIKLWASITMFKIMDIGDHK